MPALGSDVSGVDDIDQFLTLASPPKAAAQAVLCSLLHSAGVLWWAPERGHNLYDYINSFSDLERLTRGVEAECLRDERVAAASATATQFGNDVALSIELTLTQDETQVTLTLTIDQLTGAIAAGTIVLS